MLWLGCRYLPSVNTICGRIMIGLSLSSSVNTICDRIMIGLSLLSSVSKHNMRSYYDWVFVVVVRQLTQYVVVLWLGCCCCLLSVNTICGHIIIGLSSVSKHNIWSYYDWVYCLPSVNTICGRIMIGLSLLSSVSKHNMWSYYDWVVVVVVRL
jgi:hypothetical protein